MRGLTPDAAGRRLASFVRAHEHLVHGTGRVGWRGFCPGRA
jgi:hypothetical protein